jgi:hypothetical protein
MGAWWPKLTASSYGEMHSKLQLAAEEKNGRSPIDQRELPSLTNDDVLVLVEYWLTQAKRNSTSWPDWYPVTLLALGYRKEGDKFKVDKKHAESWLPAEDLPFVWETACLPFADRLDREQTATPVVPGGFAPAQGSTARFFRAAKAAWERLKRERQKPGLPPVPPQLPHPIRRLSQFGAFLIVLFLIHELPKWRS